MKGSLSLHNNAHALLSQQLINLVEAIPVVSFVYANKLPLCDTTMEGKLM